MEQERNPSHRKHRQKATNPSWSGKTALWSSKEVKKQPSIAVGQKLTADAGRLSGALDRWRSKSPEPYEGITGRELCLLLQWANTHCLREYGISNYHTPHPGIRQEWGVQRWEQLEGSKPRQRMKHTSRSRSWQAFVQSMKQSNHMRQKQRPSTQLGPQWWCYGVRTSQLQGAWLKQLDPALHMKSQLEFRMLNHARSDCNIQNKVDVE